MLSNQDREQLLLRLGGRRPRSPLRVIVSNVNWEIVVGFVVVLGFLGYILWQEDARSVGWATLLFVLVGWIFSLCLHEFSHAMTAVIGGDSSPSTERYLSFNPLRYVNPFLSILLPVLFVLLGGIALPGGAVYLRRDLVRNRVWQSAISLAGPAANVVCALLLSIPFHLGLFDGHTALANACGVLAFFQLAAVVLNLIPIPPLDGFGIVAPWLPSETAGMLYTFGNVGFILIFAALWLVPPVDAAFFNAVFNLLGRIGIDPIIAYSGYRQMFFWQYGTGV